MANGAPYVLYGYALMTLLKRKKMEPMDLLNELRLNMKRDAPSKSTLYMALSGERKLPEHVNTYLRERYDFDPGWRTLVPIENKDGARLKSNQLSLPGWKDLKI